jgi:spectrin alpha
VSSGDLGTDLEHVEVMQRKFDEFLKELDSHQSRVLDINHEANALIDEGHPEQQQIHNKREEVNDAWHKLGTLTATRLAKYLMLNNKDISKINLLQLFNINLLMIFFKA